MHKISKYKYKNFTISISVSEQGRFYGTCFELEIHSSNPNDSNCAFLTMDELKVHMNEKIDIFLKSSINTVEDLAKVIENSLTWTGYESCELNPIVLKNILKQVNPKLFVTTCK